jgi:uncharacterized RDD family membrane protein YckC
MTIVSLSVRVKSIFFDQVFLSVLGGVTNVLTRLIMEESGVDMAKATSDGSIYFGAWGALLIWMYLNKDVFSGMSIGKRISDLRIVKSGTEVSAGPLRCLVRNIFSLLWPLELVALIFSPARRIGDLVAGTRVVVTTEIGEWSKRSSENKLWLFVVLIGSYLLSFFLCLKISDLIALL